jgi:uncharacterized protein YbjT (DUF2867 family)
VKLLVTGGSGHLGRDLVAAALAAGHAVRISSRRPRPANAPANREWATLDLSRPTPEALREALAGVDAVVHAASDARHSADVDVEGGRRLFEAARDARVGHLLFVSIVGVDKNPLKYYQHKLTTERDLAASGLPHSILRAAQFHWFVDYLLGQAARTPLVMFVPAGFHVQPVDTGEVAARILRALADGPRGLLRDFAGPEPMTLPAAIWTWKSVRRVKKATLPIWLPGQTAAAFRAGSNLAPDGETGVVRWKDWLRSNAQSRTWQ